MEGEGKKQRIREENEAGSVTSLQASLTLTGDATSSTSQRSIDRRFPAESLSQSYQDVACISLWIKERYVLLS